VPLRRAAAYVGVIMGGYTISATVERPNDGLSRNTQMRLTDWRTRLNVLTRGFDAITIPVNATP
jgi:hypothetical protein